MIYLEIGQCLLKELLDKRKMTQQQLVDLTGIDKSQLSGYISNTRKMSLTNAKKIALVIKCNIDDLYEWKVER
ncbi:helix-turn-helix transcriptional regulator [uncultured Metabacillus sp.]|uniref:helix-turn-helix domain-containing protein n=1 Tax=uncultured Metabacillus sp. TaxID=2860135 RepID=UPI002638A2B9|nr:helix-turn-helix transcriptional regulator [uncultured Metabacillus sp.]